jgi:hypothetical protein
VEVWNLSGILYSNTCGLQSRHFEEKTLKKNKKPTLDEFFIQDRV